MLKSFSCWLFRKTHAREIERIKKASKTLLLRSKEIEKVTIPLERSQKLASDSLIATLSTLYLM